MIKTTKLLTETKFSEVDLLKLGFENIHTVAGKNYYQFFGENNVDDFLFMSYDPLHNYVAWYIEDVEMKRLYTLDEIEEVVNFFNKFCCE